MMQKNKIIFWGRVAILVAMIATLLHFIDIKAFIESFSLIPLYVIVLLLLLNIIRVWINSVRWRVINPDSSGQITPFEYFRFMMVATIFNPLLPGAIGGDIARTVMMLKKVTNKRIDNVIGIVADRFIGLFSTILFGTVALFFLKDNSNPTQFYIIFLALNTVLICSLLVAFNRHLLAALQHLFNNFGRVGNSLLQLLSAWRDATLFFRAYPDRVGIAFALCLPLHGLAYIAGYILAYYLGIYLSFFEFIVVLSLVWVVTSVPITFAGIGVRELALAILLLPYGVPIELAVALGILLYMITLLTSFTGAIFWFFTRDK